MNLKSLKDETLSFFGISVMMIAFTCLSMNDRSSILKEVCIESIKSWGFIPMTVEDCVFDLLI